MRIGDVQDPLEKQIGALLRPFFWQQLYTYCLPLSRFRSYAVISIASDEHPGVAKPWPGGEKRRGSRAAHHKDFEALRLFLLPCAAPGVSLLAAWYLLGATAQ